MRLTRTRPSDSDTSEAPTNHTMAFSPTRPTDSTAPIRAMPTISVDTTSGAMTILIRRRKIVVTKPQAAIQSAVSKPLSRTPMPTTMPRASAPRIQCVSLLPEPLSFCAVVCSTKAFSRKV